MISEMYPIAYQRYLSLPVLGSIIDDFAVWSHQHGYTNGTLQLKLIDACKIDRFFQENGIRCLDELCHNDFEKAWKYFHRYRHNTTITGTVRSIELFLNETHNLSPPLPQPETPISLELNGYTEYLRNIRGLESKTIKSHCLYIKEFLEYIRYDRDTMKLKSLSSNEIEAFISSCAKRLNRYSLQHVVGYLRSFLRFQYEQGVLKTPLYTMIDSPRIYRLEQLPRSIPWEMVNKLLLSIERVSPLGIRDFSMLYLIASYGLRSCEIVSLTLDDIDWKDGVIRIPQRKTANKLVVPLTDSAGDVLINYLKKSRLKVPYREIFLRSRAPHGPLKPHAVSEVFRRRVHLSGLNISSIGVHCLRHSYAMNLLKQGASIKAIGDLMGHRSPESTGVYLRLAIDDLRCVALPVPKGPAVDIPSDIIVKYCKPSNKNRNIATSSHIKSSTHLKSFLAEDIQNYINLKRTSGINYKGGADTLYYFDAFLAKHYPLSKELTAQMFDKWCTTLHHLSPFVRQSHMRVVRSLCLYRSRSCPQSFIPDVSPPPHNHRIITPYIFSESDIVRLLAATQSLHHYKYRPLRPYALRIAILLLYTTGIRRRELIRLKLGDFNAEEKTLLIKKTKFHKSRLIPLSPSVSEELHTYLRLLHKNNLPMEKTSPLVWNGFDRTNAKSYTGEWLLQNLSALCASLNIFTRKGKTPRIHDMRHSFAINVLQGWYDKGEDVQTKLPLLSTYLGHVSVDSTYYYLKIFEGISREASARFHQNFGKAITTDISHP